MGCRDKPICYIREVGPTIFDWIYKYKLKNNIIILGNYTSWMSENNI